MWQRDDQSSWVYHHQHLTPSFVHPRLALQIVEVLESRPMPDGRTRLRVPFGEGSGWISDATAKGEPIVRKLSDETERDGDELRPASVGSAVDVLQGALMQDE